MVFFSCKKEISCEGCKGNNKPPIANAGRDTIITLPKDSVLLDGSASTDPDGTITSYKWAKITGPVSSNISKPDSSKTSVKTLVMGVYKFELTVTDNGGLTAKDTMQIIVDDPNMNQPPIANAGADQTITLPTDSVLLNGNLSLDPDGRIVSYQWTKISGPSAFNILNQQLVQTGVDHLGQGVYYFELKVTDNGGLSSRDTIQIIVNVIVPGPCSNRPVINARLVQIGSLSLGGWELASATAGNKILFAGGVRTVGYSTRVDIYDIATNTWSTAELSVDNKQGTVAASVGSKVFFAGGGENNTGILTSSVDIYDASTNSWSTAQLSQPRKYLAAATIGNKVFFAGGGYWNYYIYGSSVVDIYDNSTNTWTTANLSEGRHGLSATTAGNKIYFAGGLKGPFLNNISTRIDIYDTVTNSWSTSELQEGKGYMASIAINNKIYWGSGINSASGNINSLSNQVEIRDVITGASSFSCMIPKSKFTAVVKDDNIIFFTGSSDFNSEGTHFDIYNITSNTWSTGLLNQRITDATIISVNNIIYVAGGHVNDVLSKKVWKLEF